MLTILFLAGLSGLLCAPLDLPRIVLGSIAVAVITSIYATFYAESAFFFGLYVMAGLTIYQAGYFVGFIIRVRYVLPRSNLPKASEQLG